MLVKAGLVGYRHESVVANSRESTEYLILERKKLLGHRLDRRVVHIQISNGFSGSKMLSSHLRQARQPRHAKHPQPTVRAAEQVTEPKTTQHARQTTASESTATLPMLTTDV